MTKVKSSPFNRVIFIGAGFSAGLHYPTGRDLMKQLLEYLRGTPVSVGSRKLSLDRSLLSENDHRRREQIVSNIGQVLESYFGLEVDEISQVDVAEFFSITHTLEQMPSLFGLKESNQNRSDRQDTEETSSLLSLFEDLSAALRTYFMDLFLALRSVPNDLWSFLEEVKSEHNAIVSFNWDEEVDVQLSRRPKGVSYMLEAWRADGGSLILKPHGSIGWYDVKIGVGNEDAYFISGSDKRIPRKRKRILAYDNVELPVDVEKKIYSGLSCPPVIAPPIFAKRFDYDEQQWIWQDVLTVCRCAAEFVFLGYSLPRDDFLTRAAIRSALQGRNKIKCLIVDRSFDDAKRGNFQSVFGEGLSRRNNFMAWEFGSKDGTFATQLNERMQRAIIWK